MNAGDVVSAIRAKHAGAAILTEVSISDPDWLDKWTPEQGCFGTERRIDILMWRTLKRTAIEVKVTRADFKRDTEAKRGIWRDHSHRFVYACPTGLLTPADMPDGCGLWEVSDTGEVNVTKRARINPDPSPLPEHVIQALAYRAMKQEASC